ncbi:hypothetical protein SADUNF_Sadunf14G0099000 [Salix dunnii]|uniref:Uncharacterized protein n=1 Tax=Salix dunnii TaxID=1413687 RepID=A0A835JJ03_9ROSI|nr:hypothetical protein SADUNF_Sadunf14G0099000 [Salix dunnii]
MAQAPNFPTGRMHYECVLIKCCIVSPRQFNSSKRPDLLLPGCIGARNLKELQVSFGAELNPILIEVHFVTFVLTLT